MVSMQQNAIHSMQNSIDFSKYKSCTINSVSTVNNCIKSWNASKSVKFIDFYHVIDENAVIGSRKYLITTKRRVEKFMLFLQMPGEKKQIFKPSLWKR